MKYLFLFLFLIFIIGGCDPNSILSTFYNRTESNLYSNEDDSKENSNFCDQDCEKFCAKIYISLSSERECEDLTNADVRDINDVYEKMKSGRWSSIDSGALELMVEISYEPWEKRAGGGTQRIVKNMLVWIAEISEQNDDRINELVTEDVLREAFYSLGGSRRNINGIRQALNVDLETDDSERRSFLEMLAWENNDDVFEKVHDLIKEECRSRELCIQDTYCDHFENIIYEKITDLGLHEDFTDLSRFHRGLCSS